MRNFFKHLLFGSGHETEFFEGHSAFQKQLHIIQNIWDNQSVNSFGIERLVRLFLATTQLFMPVMFVKIIFEKLNFLNRKIALESYLLFKIIFPLLCIAQEWHNNIALVINTIFLSETLLYLTNLVFLNDLTKPHSYRRALLFVFLNYIEIGLGFAAIYDYLNHFGRFSDIRPFQTKIETIYFSFVTAASIGFGDIVPSTGIAQCLVIIQSMIFFLFVAIFMGFFVSKM